MARKLFPIFGFQSNITEVGAVETQNDRKQKSIIFISNVLFTIESKATTDNSYSCTHHFLRQNLGLLDPVFLWVMLIFPFSYLTPSSLSRNKENMINQKLTDYTVCDWASGFREHLCVSPCRQAAQAKLPCNTLQDFDRIGPPFIGSSLVTFASFPLLARLGALALGLVALSSGCRGKRAVHLKG